MPGRWTNSGGAAITNPGSWLLQAVGSLVQPLFNRGTNIANLKIAKAQQQEAIFTFRQALLDAGSEVNNALTQWQTARNKIELATKQIQHYCHTLLLSSLKSRSRRMLKTSIYKVSLHARKYCMGVCPVYFLKSFMK